MKGEKKTSWSALDLRTADDWTSKLGPGRLAIGTCAVCGERQGRRSGRLNVCVGAGDWGEQKLMIRRGLAACLSGRIRLHRCCSALLWCSHPRRVPIPLTKCESAYWLNPSSFGRSAAHPAAPNKAGRCSFCLFELYRAALRLFSLPLSTVVGRACLLGLGWAGLALS